MLKNLKNLVKQLDKQSKSKWAIKEDMADMYKEDASDTDAVLTHMLLGNYGKAKKKLQRMDTLPRDNAILAIAEDFDKYWIETKLGWRIN